MEKDERDGLCWIMVSVNMRMERAEDFKVLLIKVRRMM